MTQTPVANRIDSLASSPGRVNFHRRTLCVTRHPPHPCRIPVNHLHGSSPVVGSSFGWIIGTSPPANGKAQDYPRLGSLSGTSHAAGHRDVYFSLQCNANWACGLIRDEVCGCCCGRACIGVVLNTTTECSPIALSELRLLASVWWGRGRTCSLCC